MPRKRVKGQLLTAKPLARGGPVVSPHTLRHTALSRMIAHGASDHTVMAISGHSSTRMLERYTHPTEALKVDALESGTGWVGRQKVLVDGRRIELLTSALRTRRSPS
jgi:integrase